MFRRTKLQFAGALGGGAGQAPPLLRVQLLQLRRLRNSRCVNVRPALACFRDSGLEALQRNHVCHCRTVWLQFISCWLTGGRCTLMAAASALLGRVLLISRSYVENRMPQSQPACSAVRSSQRVASQAAGARGAMLMTISCLLQHGGWCSKCEKCDCTAAASSPSISAMLPERGIFSFRRLWMRTGSYFRAPMSRKSRDASSARSPDALNHTACICGQQHFQPAVPQPGRGC